MSTYMYLASPLREETNMGVLKNMVGAAVGAFYANIYFRPRYAYTVIAPHCVVATFCRENDPGGRAAGTRIGNLLLGECHAAGFTGPSLTAGMRTECELTREMEHRFLLSSSFYADDMKMEPHFLDLYENIISLTVEELFQMDCASSEFLWGIAQYMDTQRAQVLALLLTLQHKYPEDRDLLSIACSSLQADVFCLLLSRFVSQVVAESSTRISKVKV